MNSLSLHQIRMIKFSEIKLIEGTYSRRIMFEQDSRYFPTKDVQTVSFEITLFSDNKADLKVIN